MGKGRSKIKGYFEPKEYNMTSDQSRLRNVEHTVKTARKDFTCALWSCERPIRKGEEYIHLKEGTYTERWCMMSWNNRTRINLT